MPAWHGVGGSYDGKGYRKDRPLSQFAFHKDFPPLGLDQMFYNRQPQSGPAGGAGPAGGSRPGLVDPIKALKNARQIFRRNADSSVPYRKFHPLPVLNGGNLNDAPFRGVLDGIINEVGKNLTERLRIGLH